MRRRGRPPEPDAALLGAIQALIADLPTYGYRRVHALLRRQAERDGRPAPNAKRVYRVMKVHGLLLQRHAGGAETRRHEGKVAVAVRNTRWAGPRPVSDRVACPLLGRAGDRGRER
ncbi:HTH-like domain-containing protein [Methylobacterium sp. 13MFTsu3.1M2]|nr:HTH-like domain-containing protein [Methylobacterium sp. 13MFTsu3.1M2]